MSEIRPVKVGEVVFWLGSGSGVPKRGRVKWLGRLAEIGPGLAVGLELDEELPYGGVDGQWCGRRLFPCQPKRGLIVPAGVLLRPSQAHRVVGSSSAPPREKKRIERYARIQTEEDVAGEEEARSGELRLEEGRRMTGGGLENHQDAAPSPPVERLEWRRLELAGEHRSSRSSGIFSLLKWFRKSSEEGDEIRRRSGGEDPDSGSEADSSPELPGPRCGGLSASLDSLFSTATAASFAFISPTQYRPFGPGADTPQVRIAVGPETATYRNRIRNRDRLRALEKNITLRQKYRLYASGTLPRSVDHINELKDPYDKSSQSQTLDKKKTSAPKAPTQEVKSTVSCTKEHRRTASEPYKVCHVKGKRKAPAPPSVEPDILSVSTSNSNSSRRSRKKRRAPSPPVRKANASDSDIIHIIREATSSILSEGDSSVRDDTLSTASTVDVGDVVCTDTLRLERGILKPNMEKTMSSSESKVAAPSSPVSPRPWYKRTTPSRYPTRDQRDKKKERDRRKVEDWMLESGFPRRTFHEFKHHNILSKLDKSDDKRKSQVSILTNISELDREAAEIIKRGKEKEKSQIDNHNAMFYDENMQVTEVNDNSREIHENPRKSSARDLISLFNAITNVTKVTVNSSLFPKDIKILNKESKSKCSSHKYEQNVDGKQQIQKSSSDEVMHGKFVMKSNSAEVMRDEEKAGPSSASSSSTRIARVTIQELDDFDAERNLKSQAIKPNLHNPPSVQKSGREPEPQGSASSDLTRATPTDSVPKALLTSDSKPTPVKQLNVWICPRCTLENLRWRITCEACDMWRPNPFEIREKSNTNIKEKEKNTNKTEEKSTKQMTKEANSVYPSLSPINISSSDENKETFKNSPSSDSGSTASNDIQSQQKLKGSLSTLIENKSNLNVKDISKNTEIGNSANISKTSSDDKHNSELVKEKKLHSTDKIQENSTGKLILDSEKKFDGTKKEISKTQETTKNENEEAQSELVSDEVRKARLAFFDKSSISKNKDDNKSHSIDKEEKKENSSNISEINKLTRNEFNETKNQQGNNKLEMKSDKFKSEISEPIRKPKVLCVTEDEEKNKLKEMLIEMKHSLPKRPKPFKKSENINIVSVSDDKVKTNVVAKPIPEEKLSIRVDSTPSTSSSHPGKDYAEAYLIESTTVIEEIQYNKPKSNDKVSSSVQTSGLVRQISPRIKASSGQTKYIPIRIEEHTVQDNGTDVQTEVTEGIGKMGGGGTFELLRPRDFANIRETRTDSSRSGPLPLYANVVSEDEGSQRASEELRQSTSEYIDKLSEQLVKPQGVANFRAGLTGRSEECLNTLGVNRQLKRLETAISAGDHELAARLARELAQLKVSCSVVRQGSSKDLPSVPSPPGAGEITLDVYVEDRQSSEGPFPVRVMPDRLTVGELKRRVELEFGIPASVQRWILGNQLASTEGASLEELGVNTDHFPAFLYLVAPDINGIKKEEEVQIDIGPSSSGLGSKGVIQEPTEPANQANILPAATTNIPTAATTNIPTATTTNIPTATTTTKNIPTATNLPTITTNIPTATTTINIPTATKTTPNKPAATTTNIPAATTTNIPAATITNIPPTTTTESGAALTGEWGAAQIQPGPSGLAATGTRSWLQTEDSSGTLALGWKCESCTLLNSPTRPGCAACSRPRPTDYRVPGEYRPSPAEAVRIRKEMEGEQALKVVEKEEEKAQNYQKLVDLEKDDLILYPEEFECPVCLSDYPKNEGIVLRECLHVFCRACLEQTVEFSEEAEVSCPYRDDNYTCSSLLLEREIKALVSAEAYEEHLAKSLAQAENKTANAFHCKTPDCSGWCIFEDNVNLFTCPVCTHTNCLTCQAVHEGLNCKQYQEHLASNSDSNIDVKRTKEMLQDMVRRGEALTCPTCQVVLMKKWGCDWLRCSMCKTEICWITRGPRWGPNGKGDTSGGCQCGVNGIKCHPKCTYCH